MAKRTCTVEGCTKPHVARGWCDTHYCRWKRGQDVLQPNLSRSDVFWSKVEKTSTCWLWKGYTQPKGYGIFDDDGKWLAHRWVYEQIVGPIPKGLQLDHLCRVRNCVNPDHLEPVTNRENVLRGKRGVLHVRPTRCPHGHPYTDENTYVHPRLGTRSCRACRRAQGAIARRKAS